MTNNLNNLYEGFMTCECVWHDTVQYTFYLEDCLVQSVDITYRKNKMQSIEWYIKERHYEALSIEQAPIMWQRLFNKLNQLIIDGETELDYFSL